MVEVNPSNNPPNARQHYEVTKADLPLSCPMRSMRLWDGHPRVYLPIEKTGQAVCPYCDAEYTLVDAEAIATNTHSHG